MKQIKNLFVGIILSGGVYASALPYSPNTETASTYLDANRVCKENTHALSVSSPVFIQEGEQQISQNEYTQDKKSNPTKKRNRYQEKQ